MPRYAYLPFMELDALSLAKKLNCEEGGGLAEIFRGSPSGNFVEGRTLRLFVTHRTRPTWQLAVAMRRQGFSETFGTKAIGEGIWANKIAAYVPVDPTTTRYF